MKRTRILSLVLVVVMMLFAAACTNKNTSGSPTGQPATKASKETMLINKTGYPIAKEPLTITAKAKRATDCADWNDLWCFRKILEITNLDFEIDNVNEESWEEKINLVFASQNLPDMFFVRSGDIKEVEVANYGVQGLLIPQEGYMEEYAPLLTEYFEEYPDVKKCQMSPDGHIYELHTFIENERERSTRRYWLNTAWIENLDMMVPTNTDEFYDVMMAFKEQDANGNGDPNDEIPITGMYNSYQAMDIPLLVAFGYVDTRIDTLGENVVYVPTEENYKHYLEYFNKLYDSGLVDPDYFSQAKDQFIAKGAEGTYGTICYSAEWLIMTDEEGYSQYESPKPLVSEYNEVQMWPARTTVLSGGVAITNKCEYPQAIVRLMDWFCTLEGTLIAQYGPENGTWEGGEGGWTLVTRDGVTGYEVTWPEQYSSYNEFRQQELNPMRLPIMSKPEGIPVGQYYTGLNPKQVKLTNDIVENFAPYYKVAFPMAKMTAEEAQEISSIETDLEPYVQQMEARFMTGEESFDDYETFIQGCKDRGSDRLVKLYQQVLDRFNSN